MATAAEFLDEKPTAEEFLKQPSSSSQSAEEFLQPQIKLDPYQQAYLTTQAKGRPMLNPEREGEGEFAYQIFKQLPEDVSNVARGVGSDLLLMTPHESTFANTKAALYREPLPVDKDLAELAKTDPITATAGHVAQDLMAVAPMAPAFAAGGWPLMLAMGTQMLSEAPDQVRELGEELGKNKADQNPDKIAQLRAKLLQTTVFTALPAAHGVGRLTQPKTIVTPSVTEPAGSSPTGVPTVTPVEPAAPIMTLAERTTGRPMSAKEIEEWNAENLIQEKGQPNASTIRENQGQLREGGQTAQGSEANRGGNLEQGASGRSESVEPGAQGTPNVQGEAEKVAAVAYRNKATGEILRGNPREIHPQVLERLGIKYEPNLEDGFITDSGRFITRDEAFDLGGAGEADTLQKVKAWAKAGRKDKLTNHYEVYSAMPEEEAAAMADRMIAKYQGEGAAEVAREPEKQQEVKPPAPGEIVGMGGATPSEFGPNEGADITGVAQRVREKVAAASQEALPPRGEGISAEDAVKHGEALLTADPTAADVAMDAFEKDPSKAVSFNAMTLARAKLRRLAFSARRIEERFGTDSPQYRAAWQARSEWAARVKKMQTEWHAQGQAQQGEQDIDTGTFTGLREAYTDATGKDFTPGQEKTAKDVSGRVKKAEEASASANTKLKDELSKQSGESGTDAEKRALDAANKTVRENAAWLADAENKSRVAQTAEERATAKIQEDAARKALEASEKTVREAAAKLADAENKARVEAAAKRPPNDQEIAAKKALDAANKVARRAAADAAKAEAKARVAKTESQKASAKVQEDATKRALDAANKAVRDAAERAAKAEVDARVNPEKRVWEKVKEYLDQGMDSFDDMRNKVATDLGMSVRKVTDILTSSKRAKFLANDAWRKQEALRRFQSQAKRWLQSTQTPGYQQALAAIPRTLFALKVGFHGTVALGTHAPMLAFQPTFWKQYIQNFGRMYRMVGLPNPKGQSSAIAYYERQVQDLLRRPNYITARRAGLQNDPSSYEEYAIPGITGAIRRGADAVDPRIVEYFNKITGMGNRGYAVLKILRQDLFDHHWNNLPQTLKSPDMAAAIADGVNHVTGVVKAASPKGANVALFAPRLLASRVAWLGADPIRAADTFLRWNKSSPAEKRFAIQQAKEKAWVAGTMLSLLAMNQGMLKAVGSDQEVNFTDPFRSDFLKFKAFGQNISYGNAMLTMARLPIRLYRIRESDGGKLKNLIYPDEDSYNMLGEYGRSQMSPFASLATSLWLKSDWQNRPLPSSDRPMPKRLRMRGVEPYTWPEFWTEQFLPIPFQEATHEVWAHGLGMDNKQMKAADKAIATASILGKVAAMAGTGGRISPDYDVSP